MEQELPSPDETVTKKYLRNYTEEGREKQKAHLNNIRQLAMQKKRELKEITLKSKLMKLEPKLDLAKQYDEYVNNKNQLPRQEPEPEEQIVYVKKNKPKPQESLERTLYKSSTKQLHLRAVEERIRHNLTSCYNALMPREY